MRFIVRLLILTCTLVAIATILPGITVTSFHSAFIAVCILSIINALVRPILILLTLPITVVTLGLFVLVINASLFLFVASFVDGFTVDGFWPAIFGSICMSIVSTTLNSSR